jgi:hypothetical protein
MSSNSLSAFCVLAELEVVGERLEPQTSRSWQPRKVISTVVSLQALIRQEVGRRQSVSGTFAGNRGRGCKGHVVVYSPRFKTPRSPSPPGRSRAARLGRSGAGMWEAVSSLRVLLSLTPRFVFLREAPRWTLVYDRLWRRPKDLAGLTAGLDHGRRSQPRRRAHEILRSRANC